MTRATILAALAGVLAAYGAGEWATAWAAARHGRTSSAPPLRGADSTLVRPRGPLLGVLARVGAPLAHVAPSGVEDRIAAAGLTVTAGDLAAAKAGAALLAPLLLLPWTGAFPGHLGLLALLLSPAAGFAAPDLLLSRRAQARALRLDAELPDVLDLLRVAVAAGYPPSRALREVARRHPGGLAAELGEIARRESLGVTRADALAAFRRRAPGPALATLAAALDRAGRHGAPLEDALAGLADDARARRARAATETAARAAPQIQLVVALVLVPSVLLLVAAALIPALTG
jgi:tight adherence protein C